jgi:hypothetical protein
VDKLWGILGNLGVFGEMGRKAMNEWSAANGILAGADLSPYGPLALRVLDARSEAWLRLRLARQPPKREGPRSEVSVDGNACLGVARRRLKSYG